jgi:Fe-S-cluster-containing dehydrogenase component/DMSO reductase anchor subunit
MSDPEPRTLIDDLLAEQRTLTAVERFARAHERHEFPAQQKHYRDLIPLNAPQPGEQYAFAVNLDTCTGCKACVSACHSLNGLEDGELWREVGLLHGGTARAPFQQTITTACHHCADPACANGCPVLAYEKDAATGIVRHLDDQCIGCQYCVLKCPYDVPKYSENLGIVRKCDMCQSRLAAGEAPACVQACPNEAIRIEVVKSEAVASEGRMLPGVFENSYTRPTTTYRTSRDMPATVRDGAEKLRLEHAHWPLIFMLVLTQAAAGAYGAAFAAGGFVPVIFATVLLHAGLAVSVLHLGRPLGAWRFFLGLRKSWMSREILVFGMFAGCGTAFAGVVWLGWKMEGVLGIGTLVLAAAGITCSVMIYVDTRRPAWSALRTFAKFFGTAIVLGLHALAVFSALPQWLAIAVAAQWIFAGMETRFHLGALDDEAHPAHRSALTTERLLGGVEDARTVAMLLGALCAVLAFTTSSRWPAVAAFVFAGIAAIAERHVFFAASCAPRMPGGTAR